MSIRVLVVEDDAVAAEAHAAYIERTRGSTLSGVALSFQDAVQLLGEHEIDLVLLDLHCPTAAVSTCCVSCGPRPTRATSSP